MSDWKMKSVLIVGLGSIGKRHTRVLRELGVKNITVCDVRSEAVLNALAEFPGISSAHSFEEGLAGRPDCAFILTPPKLHIPQIIRAAEMGVHVFVEKPLSDTLEGVCALRAVLEETGITLGVGLCFRYHDGVCALKRSLETGEVGRLVSIQAMMGEHLPSVRPDYRNLFTAKYSGAFDLMHDLDLAMWLAGADVKRAFSVAGSYSDIGIEAPDVVEILIDFENRCTANVHLDFFQQPRTRKLELLCTEGKLTLEFASWDEYTISRYAQAEGKWERQTFQSRRDDMFAQEDAAFLRCISGEDAILYGLEDGLLSLKLIASLSGERG